MPTESFPNETVTVKVGGYPVRGSLVKIDQKNTLGLYYFPDDAILGDGWDTWLSPQDARSAETVKELVRTSYSRFRK
jgi:hypothetical protein